MKPTNSPLGRLLRAAARADTACADQSQPAPPFGFETRVLAALAAARRGASDAVLDLVFRRASATAAAVLCLCVCSNYQALTELADVFHDPRGQMVGLAQGALDARPRPLP